MTRALRNIALQVGVALGVVVLFAFLGFNAADNLQRQGIASGFGFLGETAGFAIIQTPIFFDESSSYLRAFYVGLLNTIIVSLAAIILSTILGFAIGLARLSKNWLMRKCADAYVETIRNIPLLILIYFAYLVVVESLPIPRNAISIGDLIFFTNRGIYIPAFSTAAPYWVELPTLRGFNFSGGLQLIPELVTLIFALSIYTASFIAEIVRAGIQSVAKGQWEAASALGLTSFQVNRYVIVPQAMRVIIPPLSSQYLNATKNSSLAAVIGYPDLVQVFAGTVLNQTGQAVEILFITMMVYLTVSLTISLAMNIYNYRMALEK